MNLIGLIPNACRREIFEYLTALEMAAGVMTTKDWGETLLEVGKQRVMERFDETSRGMVASDQRPWLRVLRFEERLAKKIGTPTKSWRDEWTDLERQREFVLAGSETTPEQSLRYVQPSADWKFGQGWHRDIAIGHKLIMTKFKSVLGESIRGNSPRFAGSCFLICDTLNWRAHCEPVAPLAYNDLNGPYGLRRADNVWGDIATASIGHTFETTTPLEASASPACLTATGFRAPVIDVKGDSTDVQYQPQDSDIVCFESLPPDGAGCHSLVRTAQTQFELQYDLPPLAKITLVNIQEPGTWSAFKNSITPRRRLYTVRVSFL